MSPSPISLSPAPTSTAPHHGPACPLAANCTCIFQKGGVLQRLAVRDPAPSAQPDAAQPAAAPGHPELDAAVATWADWGWTVVRSAPTEVVLERRRRIAFCFNLGLTVVTGFLWLIYWIPRARRPRFDTVTLTLASDGTVASSARLH